MKQRFTEIDVNKKLKRLLVLSILFTVIFISTIFIRHNIFSNSSLPGKEVYFNLNSAKDILNLRSNFVLEEKDIRDLIWPAIIAASSFILRVPVEASVLIITLVFGLLSLILIYLVADKLGFKKKNIALVLFLISPATIWLYATYGKYIPALFFSLLTLYLLLISKDNAALLTFAFASFFGIISTVATLLISFLAFRKGFFSWLAKAVAIGVVISIFAYALFPPFESFTLSFDSFFALFFSLSVFGVSIFAFLIAIIGIIMTWHERKQRKELLPTYAVFLALLFLSVLNKEFIFFFNFVLVFLAATGLTKLVEREWASQLIRNLVLLILIVALIFPALIFPVRIANMQPEKELVSAFGFLRSQENGKVLSIAHNGFWIEYFSGKEALVDDFKAAAEPEINDKATSLLMERELKNLSAELDAKGLKYVFIDSKTREIFRTEDEGILLLLKYTDVFSKIYNQGKIEIWKFNSTEEIKER